MPDLKATISLEDKTSSSLDKIVNKLDDTTSAFEKVDQASEEMEEKVKKSAEGASSSLDGISGAISKIASAAIVMKGIDFFKDQASSAIEYASSLSEVENVTSKTFGAEGAKKIEAFSKTTIKTLGISELEAKRYSGVLGSMIKSSGVNGDIEQMSERLVKLTGDMASFHNLDTEEAFTKIKAGISGETEPLKALGYNMNVAQLEAYAMAHGFEESFSKLDYGTQTMIRYNYLLDQTKDLTDDFIDTSDSFANQTRVLSKQWEQFTGTIAAGAIPSINSVLSSIIGVEDEMNSSSDTLMKVGVYIGNTVIALENIVISIINGVIASGVVLWNYIGAFANFFGNVFNNPVVAIAHLFTDLFDVIVDTVSTAANCIDSLLGTDMSESIDGFKGTVDDFVNKTVGENKVEVMKKLNVSDLAFAHVDYKDPASVLAANQGGKETDVSLDHEDKDTNQKIADNTKDIADKLDITSQNLKYIRDYAENRAINRYTGTTVNVEMTNNNTVSSGADIEEIGRKLVDVINTEIASGAEGVFA